MPLNPKGFDLPWAVCEHTNFSFSFFCIFLFRRRTEIGRIAFLVRIIEPCVACSLWVIIFLFFSPYIQSRLFQTSYWSCGVRVGQPSRAQSQPKLHTLVLSVFFPAARKHESENETILFLLMLTHGFQNERVLKKSARKWWAAKFRCHTCIYYIYKQTENYYA